ncbi:hypothetical protein BCR32DRAFT_294596 [Anaeromyces robustus]|uniref:Uncharacterized protein n=1 Tax=Anaeromyces robustus TaxID=1754192 RepID=A0A1Y1X006_9FUNG|nr:hypothetical protein BCR32DRAFT_294596 [Anaeromyces robustus]|eukprot:ORX79141.1 hypothetical protein BCR32DRAFT_294596 [Anaeromyces robustus]
MIKIILLILINCLTSRIIYGDNLLSDTSKCYHCKNEVLEENTNTNTVTDIENEVVTVVAKNNKTKTFKVTKVLTKDRNGVQTLKEALVCRHCLAYATGTDGNYWGFEYDNVCILSEECKEEIHNKHSVLRSAHDNIRICRRCHYTKKDNITRTMWNIEDNEECRVVHSRCPNIKSHMPFCKGCVVNSIGHDLSLLGYEHRRPCIINEIKCDFDYEDNRFISIDKAGNVTSPNSGSFSIFKKKTSIHNLYITLFLTILYYNIYIF